MNANNECVYTQDKNHHLHTRGTTSQEEQRFGAKRTKAYGGHGELKYYSCETGNLMQAIHNDASSQAPHGSQ